MNKPARFRALCTFVLLAIPCCIAQPASAPRARRPRAQTLPTICADCIRAHMDFLASDALRGRGSATPDELIAATYIASELMQYGISPAGDNDTFLQRVPLVRRSFAIPPQLRFTSNGEEVTWKHGLNFLALHVGEPEVSGPLQTVRAGTQDQVQKGAFVLLTASADEQQPSEEDARAMFAAGAVAVMIPAGAHSRNYWQETGEELYAGRLELADASGKDGEDKSTIITLDDDAMKRMASLPVGTQIRLIAPLNTPQPVSTWDVLGELKANTPADEDSAVLFSAHLDHLGVGKPVNGDNIYNGADDDASGVTAVLEIARVLAHGARPHRTVVFALFGSEELGDLGAKYFLEHPALPLDDVAVNLNFEMIGRPDPDVGEDTLWITGWSRSNLGPELAAHGAKVVDDPHPEQHFFRRSDNYPLAKKGVVAQTISSYGLHPDYHQPGDDLEHIDFKHMDDAIASLLKPILWLVNGNFTPEWKRGQQP